MENHGIIAAGTASSYAIECLLVNVPQQHFGGTYQMTFASVVDWLARADTDMTDFVCQNGVQRLFKQNRWTIQMAHTFIGALIRMWQEWGRDARVRF